MKKCPKCGTPVKDEYLFCHLCAADLRIKTCIACHKELPEDALFCPWCGKNQQELSKAQVQAKPEAGKPAATAPVSKPSEPAKRSDGMIRCLSDLKDRSLRPIKEDGYKRHSADHDARMAALADAFFGKAEKVLVDKIGNTPEIRFEAISRLEKFWENFRGSIYTHRTLAGSGAYNAHKDCITYEYNYIPGGPCYDGGNYSDDPDIYETIGLYKITAEEYEEGKRTKKPELKGGCPFWRYAVDLPFEDQSELIACGGTLLCKDPMGIVGYYKMTNVYEWEK